MKRRWIGTGIFISVLVLILFFLKVYFNSQDEYRKGEDAFLAGDFKEAILHYDRALHWYTPGSATVGNSIERLWEIGTKMEEKREKDTALKAYWSLRSGLYGVRSFYTPHSEWIEKANSRIALIWSKQDPNTAEEKRMTREERKASYLVALRKDWAPKTVWAAATEVGFFGWVGSVLIFIFTFLKSGGGLAGRKALLWGSCGIGFYVLWILGMIRA